MMRIFKSRLFWPMAVGFLHTIKGVILSVLHFDPVLAATATIRSIAAAVHPTRLKSSCRVRDTLRSPWRQFERIGLAQNNWLLYLTGGVAAAQPAHAAGNGFVFDDPDLRAPPRAAGLIGSWITIRGAWPDCPRVLYPGDRGYQLAFQAKQPAKLLIATP